MILNYKEAINKYGSDYKLKKLLKEKQIYQVSKGLYSSEEFPNETAIICKKYNNVVITLFSALEYYDLTNYYAEKPSILTLENAFHISQFDVNQYFTNRKYFEVGINTVRIDGVSCKIMDKERLLLEVIRYQTKIPYEEYRHILGSYLKIKNELDYNKLYKYTEIFKEKKKLIKTLENIMIG